MKDLDSIKAYEMNLKRKGKRGGGVVEQRKKQDRA